MKQNRKKFYTVFVGYEPGVYDNWEETALNVMHFSGSNYKSYPTKDEAEKAYKEYVIKETLIQERSFGMDNQEIDYQAWAVDASCLQNPGVMEFRGVDLNSKAEIFHSEKFYNGTNNIGEFLAIVKAWQLMTQKGRYHNIYSDSSIAISWIKKGRANTMLKLKPDDKLFQMLLKAEEWLKKHVFPMKILKWETKLWGEIPADFGRK